MLAMLLGRSGDVSQQDIAQNTANICVPLTVTVRVRVRVILAAGMISHRSPIFALAAPDIAEIGLALPEGDRTVLAC
jgi:hypothetical protein